MAMEMDKRDHLKTVVLEPPEPLEIALPPGVQHAIARGLRQAYGPVLSDPVPERFAKLLADLASSENKK